MYSYVTSGIVLRPMVAYEGPIKISITIFSK